MLARAKARAGTCTRGRGMDKQLKVPIGSLVGMNVAVLVVCFWFYEHEQPLFRTLVASGAAYLCLSLNAVFAITWRRLKQRSTALRSRGQKRGRTDCEKESREDVPVSRTRIGLDIEDFKMRFSRLAHGKRFDAACLSVANC
jgi:hypothetical protein